MEIGILDYKGENKNPLNNKDYSEKYKKLASVWKNFPVYSRRHEILDIFEKNQVVLVQSSTGSGKTVLLPKLLLHHLKYQGKIAITLPKQIISKSAAEFAALTLDVDLGKEVGYQYKGSPKNAKSNESNEVDGKEGIAKKPPNEEFKILRDIINTIKI